VSPCARKSANACSDFVRASTSFGKERSSSSGIRPGSAGAAAPSGHGKRRRIEPGAVAAGERQLDDGTLGRRIGEAPLLEVELRSAASQRLERRGSGRREPLVLERQQQLRLTAGEAARKTARDAALEEQRGGDRRRRRAERVQVEPGLRGAQLGQRRLHEPRRDRERREPRGAGERGPPRRRTTASGARRGAPRAEQEEPFGRLARDRRRVLERDLRGGARRRRRVADRSRAASGGHLEPVRRERRRELAERGRRRAVARDFARGRLLRESGRADVVRREPEDDAGEAALRERRGELALGHRRERRGVGRGDVELVVPRLRIGRGRPAEREQCRRDPAGHGSSASSASISSTGASWCCWIESSRPRASSGFASLARPSRTRQRARKM
jgi:hypothetical protein